jgi:hypothetical protein
MLRAEAAVPRRDAHAGIRRLAVRPVNCPSSFGFMLRLAVSHVIGRHRNSVIRQTGTAQT